MGIPMKSLVGQVFDRLTVKAEFLRPDTRGSAIPWLILLCSCGKFTEVRRYNILKGKTVSCGCYAREIHTTHGQTGSLTYRAWAGMLDRCTNTKHKYFKDYGGRGITVCGNWLKFENFYADMGDVTKGLKLERVDNNLGYIKENCVWVDSIAQANNRRSSVRWEYRGENLDVTALAILAKPIGISVSTLIKRLYVFNWSAEDAVNMPRYAKPRSEIGERQSTKLYA